VTNSPKCTDIRLLLPELALGTLTGHDRAQALEHLGGCADCRRELQSLSEVADEMLMLAPSAEPPMGFESRVLERVGATRRARMRGSRRVALVAAALLAALIGGAAVYAAGAADRELAGSYRATLAVADGEYFAARPLEKAGGAEAGHVFGYQGSPSWVFCVVRAGREDATYDIEITALGGDTWSAGDMQVEGGRGTWAQPLGVDLHDVQRLRLVDRSTGETLVATW
jgi:Putative zinc-finger